MSSLDEEHLFNGANIAHLSMLIKNLDRLREEQTLCNIDLISMDGKRVRCHRNVLAASSEYFRAMFTVGMRESRKRKIKLNEVKHQSLNPLIKFCYTGVLELTEDTVEDILRTAGMLQMTFAADECVRFMVRYLTPSNCLGVELFAEQQNCFALKRHAEKYIRENFMEVYLVEEFGHLTFNRLTKLIQSDDLAVESEENVFTAIVLWIKHNPHRRRFRFYVLLTMIRLQLLSPTFLYDHIWPVCRELGGESQLARETQMWRCMRERQTQMSVDVENIKPRKWTNTQLLSVSSFKDEIHIDKYCPTTEVWTAVGQVHSRRDDFAAAILNDKLMIVGGAFVRSDSVLDSVLSFDMKTKSYTELNPMLVARAFHGVVVHKGLLYAIGGFDGVNLLDSAERYDPVTETWDFIAPMSIARVGVGVAVLAGRLYAIGGHDGLNKLRSTECYDVGKNRWFARASMHQECRDFAVTACRDYVYAVGRIFGREIPKVERYDPYTNEWTQISSLTYPHYDIRCTYLRGSLLIGARENRAIEEWSEENASTVRIQPNTNMRLWSLLPIPKIY